MRILPTGLRSSATVLATAALLTFGGSSVVGPAHAADAYNQIWAMHSNKCLDVSDAGKADGTNVKQWSCVNAPQQKWQLRSVGGDYYQIVAQHSGKCLDVSDAGKADGTNVKQWTCKNVPQQKWKKVPLGATGFSSLVAQHSGKCLDVSQGSRADGANVQQWTCVFSAAQQKWFV